ncbi:hypothetical protein [Bradyrhizobium liaoningense]|uniref:hypothetical protein n=1 Tax=Bradyrhizobium liaoningense TaxID=43992 RepID=UPI001BA4B304|nr:hypothetical protein [Bradyrhizobium liaoningense]MBR0822807.1 hypothetical protein [Bradyrhizobium liaoningense]
MKAADASQKQSPFCEKIRALTSEAATLFTAISKEKREQWFIEPGTLGSKGVKIGDLVPIDEYVTTVTLKRHTPVEDKACIDYGFHKKAEDRKLRMGRFRP